jgi:hypothetical protein
MEELKEILDKLKRVEIKSNPMPFNMLYIAYQDIYGKEVLHSKLLAGLLDPNENHKFGQIPLKKFLVFINIPYTELSEVSVETEKNINGRRIDIFVSWKDRDKKKHAVIIENKLHNAADQRNQLNDYYEGITGKGYIVEKIVYLPFNKSHKTFEHTDTHDEVKKLCINIDANDIVNGFLHSIEQASDLSVDTSMLKQYKEFFECLINTKFTCMKAIEILQQLNNKDIFNLENLMSIMRSPEWCEALFTEKHGNLLPDLQQNVSGLQLKFKQNGEYVNYVQLYFDNWAEKGYWYEIWLYPDGFYVYKKLNNGDYSGEKHFVYHEENKLVKYIVPLLKELS